MRNNASPYSAANNPRPQLRPLLLLQWAVEYQKVLRLLPRCLLLLGCILRLLLWMVVVHLIYCARLSLGWTDSNKNPALPDPRESEDSKANPDSQEKMERLDLLDLKDRKAIPAHEEKRENLDRRLKKHESFS